METKLLQLETPERTISTEENSLNEIKHRLQRDKRKNNITYYSTLMSAAILALVLIASFLSTPSTVTTASGKGIKSVEVSHYTEFSPWYLLDRNMLSSDEIQFISNILAQQEQNKPYPHSKNTFSSDMRYAWYNFLITFDDGTTATYQYKEVDQTNYFIDVSTLEYTILTKEEVEPFFYSVITKDERNNLYYVLAIIVMIGLYIGYLQLVRRLSPSLRQKVFYKASFLKYALKCLLFLILVGIIIYLLDTFSHYNNALVALGFITFATFVRLISEDNNKRSFKEVPFTILVYWVAFLLWNI